MKLGGRGILITGASRGLGKAIAQACLDEGGHVFLCARGKKELERTRAQLAARAGQGQEVLAQVADVSQPRAVASLVRSAASRLPSLDGVVNNAGMLGPIGALEDVDWAQWERTLGVNLLGPAFLCRCVLPWFRKRGYGKIVNLSGGGAASPRPRCSAYAASKAAVVRFTETLAEETKGTGIDVNVVAPGPLNTSFLDELLAAGPEMAGADAYQSALKQKEEGGVSPEQAAALCVFLLSAESDGITGRLLSAVWDPWNTLARRRDELAGSDIYTLRRIVPKDRGLPWG